jgi:transposase InsO family protein
LVESVATGSPWQNPFVESFNSRARDELFAREIFHSIMEARVLYDDWRHTYNPYRPHSALNWLPPAQYASQWSGATIQ